MKKVVERVTDGFVQHTLVVEVNRKLG
jgi:hypothetical protein